MAKKLLRIIVPGLVLIVILGAGFYWQQPNRVLNQAVKQLGESSSQRFNITLEMQNVEATRQLLGEKSTVTVSVDGVFNRRNPRAALAADIGVLVKTESVSVEIGGQMKFIDDQTYFLISKAPSTIPVLTTLKGQWIAIPRGDQKEPTTAVGVEQLFTNTHRVSLGHYQATAHDVAIVHMMDSIAGLLGTRLNEQQVAQLRQSISQVKEVPVEVWMTAWGHELTQLSATLKTPSGNDVRLTMKFADRNKSVEIKAPEGARSLQDVLGK